MVRPVRGSTTQTVTFPVASQVPTSIPEIDANGKLFSSNIHSIYLNREFLLNKKNGIHKIDMKIKTQKKKGGFYFPYVLYR